MPSKAPVREPAVDPYVPEPGQNYVEQMAAAGRPAPNYDAPMPEHDRPERGEGRASNRTEYDPRVAASRRRAQYERDEYAAYYENNPFIGDEAGIVPKLPYDPDWAYKLVRILLGGKDDMENLFAVTRNGKANYEFVKWDDLSDEAKAVCAQYKVTGGPYADHIQVRDTMLMRIPMHTRNQMVAADRWNAARQREAPARQAAEMLRQRGSHATAFEDREFYER